MVADAEITSMSRRLAGTSRSIFTFVLCLLALYWARTYDYLLFHGLAEIFSVVIAAGIFMVVWNSRRLGVNGYFQFIGIACLFAGGLDLVHTLAYKGMGVFRGYDADLATQLWIAARYLQAVSFLLAPLFLTRSLRMEVVVGAYAATIALLLLSIFRWHIFPHCLIEGSGLTAFKINSEYIICLILLAAIVLLYRRRQSFDRGVLHLLIASLAATIASELAFTLYVDPYGALNLIGHYLKIIAFYLIYKAVIETALARPYELLFRDLKQSEEALREAKGQAESANQAKDRFLAVLSHELRTPLTPVLAVVSARQGEADLSPQLRQDLEMIHRNVDLQARLIDDLLDLTRITRGKLELSRSDVEVHGLLSSVLEICRSDANAKGLKLVSDLRAMHSWVHGDGARLQQVFWNLLRNAIKFTPAGGTITIRTRTEGLGVKGEELEKTRNVPVPELTPHPYPLTPSLAIDVADTGIGIEPDVLPRVFDAFEQGGRNITRQFGGLGLGLSISQALVQRHGGTLTAHSAGQGHGATFTVALPTCAKPVIPSAADASPSRPHSQTASRQLRILLVEDHADTAYLMSRLLERLNHQVQTAGSIAAALATAGSGPFDLVISDLGLPDGSGLDLMRQLRAKYDLKGICLSGFGMDKDLLASREAGFLYHLVKPVNFQTLKATIEQAAG